MDFTIEIFKSFLMALKNQGFSFQTFEEFLEQQNEKVILFRHDVDALPQNSLAISKIEHSLSIKGTYYFRIIPKSWNLSIIEEIAELGHEIGYHYETMDTCKGNIDKAYDEFCKNLEIFRNVYPVKTICMHGSPMSKFDNRDIWKKYNYRDLGIIGEPFFDIDFNKMLYLTDTGRRWDGVNVSVRDKVQTSDKRLQNPSKNTANCSFRHTKDIIDAIERGMFPNQVMITIHPQRWNDSLWAWTEELLLQNLKNMVKWGLIKIRR